MSTRKICCLGDSITWTATTRSIHPYPHYLEQLLGPGFMVGNQAVSGYTISQIQSLYSSYVAGKGYDDVVLLGGINDLRVGTAAATVFATWQAIVDAILAEGKRVVGLTVLEMKDYASAWTIANENKRLAFNASVRTYLSGRANCTLIDAATEFANGSDLSKLKTVWDVGDNLHPNQAGTYRIAQLVEGAITGSTVTIPNPYFADGVTQAYLPSITPPWDEVSGICRAQRSENSGYMWAITDNGNNPAVLRAIRIADGADGGIVTLTGAAGADTEDIASATVGGQPYIYVADIGDNSAARTTVNIWRVKEPVITGGNFSLSSPTQYEGIVAQYPGTPTGEGGTARRDAETLLVDPDTGDMYVLTKRTTQVQVFYLPHAASYSGTQTLTYLGDAYQPANTENPNSLGNGGRCVGGDISPDGREIVFKNYQAIFYFYRQPGQTILSALQNSEPHILKGYVGGKNPSCLPNSEPQGEAVMFGADGVDLYTASEYSQNFSGGKGYNAFLGLYPFFKYTRLTKPYVEVAFQDGVAPTAAYTGTSDTYLYSLSGSNATVRGSETTFVVDWNVTSTDERYGLLKFDLATIPATAQIVGVDLELFINTEGAIFRVYEMLEAWDENTTHATLDHLPAFNDVQAASTPECIIGDYTGLVTGAGGIDSIVLKLPTATVQRWIDGTRTNNGYVLYCPSTVDEHGATGNGFQFRSKQYATAANRPRLTVRYTQ